MAHEIKTLPALDIVGIERRTWYVVEWQDKPSSAWCEVFKTQADRDTYVKNLREGSENVTVYELLTPDGFSIDEVERYIFSGNSRIDEKV